jgi:hypothetical protein
VIPTITTTTHYYCWYYLSYPLQVLLLQWNVVFVGILRVVVVAVVERVTIQITTLVVAAAVVGRRKWRKTWRRRWQSLLTTKGEAMPKAIENSTIW